MIGRKNQEEQIVIESREEPMIYDTGNGPLARAVMIGTLAFGFIGVVTMFILKQMEKVNKAKVSEAWARAAQLDAQANMIDARTAQLSTVLVGVLPIAMGVLIVLASVVMLWSVAYLLRSRSEADSGVIALIVREEIKALAEPKTQLHIPADKQLPRSVRMEPRFTRQETSDPHWPVG